MYKAASDAQNPMDGFVKIFKGSAIASAGGIVFIVILLFISAAVINAVIPDPDSYMYIFLLIAVSLGCLATGYASVVLSRAGLSSALLSGVIITILTCALALLFGGPLTFGNHLIMIICVCAFSCAGGLLKSKGKGAKKHPVKPKKPVKRPLKH